jgi:hypothetical protein
LTVCVTQATGIAKKSHAGFQLAALKNSRETWCERAVNSSAFTYLTIDKSSAYVMPLRRFFSGTFLEFRQRKKRGLAT